MDYEKFCKFVDGIYTPEEIQENYSRNTFNAIDTDKDGYIDFDEFKAFNKEMGSDEELDKKKLKEDFDKLAKNNKISYSG